MSSSKRGNLCLLSPLSLSLTLLSFSTQSAAPLLDFALFLAPCSTLTSLLSLDSKAGFLVSELPKLDMGVRGCVSNILPVWRLLTHAYLLVGCSLYFLNISFLLESFASKQGPPCFAYTGVHCTILCLQKLSLSSMTSSPSSFPFFFQVSVTAFWSV
jgi:hypothetical protein